MAIDRSGDHWRGENFDDLAAYIRLFEAGGYDVEHVREHSCPECRGTSFRVLIDDEQGCAFTICHQCQAEAAIADSADQLDDAELEECACPCGAETFAVATGFAMFDATEIRHISVGLRCLTDGTLGVYTDWQIDYSPSAHLLTNA